MPPGEIRQQVDFYCLLNWAYLAPTHQLTDY